jgi:hypothetical protein
MLFVVCVRANERTSSALIKRTRVCLRAGYRALLIWKRDESSGTFCHLPHTRSCSRTFAATRQQRLLQLWGETPARTCIYFVVLCLCVCCVRAPFLSARCVLVGSRALAPPRDFNIYTFRLLFSQYQSAAGLMRRIESLCILNRGNI